MSLPPTLSDFESIVEETISSLPNAIEPVARQVAVRITDWPDVEMLTDLDLEEPLELTGLYDGVPLTERSVMDQPASPDIIWLFRRPILDEWVERGNIALSDLVRHVYIHELAHHFGWSDDDIATIDHWWT
jgi:predicted Zn-dependent protease with MMP-like domain